MNPSQSEGRFERLFSVNGRVRLEIETDSGTVRVSTGEPGAVRIRGILRANPSIFGLGDPESRVQELAADPPIKQDGNDIRVGHDSGNWLLGSITLLLDVTVPQDSSVHARADSGGIRIEGVRGPVDCRTDSGYVEAVGIGSDVRAKADSGRIEIRQVAGGVEAKVDSGDLVALEIGGRIEARADSGDIQLSQTVAAPLRAKADSGRIRVRLAAGSGYTLRARADTGNIHVPDLTRSERSKKEVSGDIRGGGPSVDLEADSGDIDVE